MKKTILALIVSSIAIFGQVPKDVDGWNKIKWGMTLGEAKATLESNSVTVGDVKLSVHLSAARTDPDRYNAVTKPIAEVELSNLIASASDYATIKTPLIQKYGKPTTEDTVPDGAATESRSVWIFPSTVITLTFRSVRGSGSVELLYDPADKKAKDAL